MRIKTSSLILACAALLLILSPGLQEIGLAEQISTAYPAGAATGMQTAGAGSKPYEYGQPPLDDNGGSQALEEPPDPRELPPGPPGGDYPDTVTVEKTAAEVPGCRTYEVNLSISGDPHITDARPIDLVVLIDVSASMDEGAPSVWTKGKKHAVTFAQNIAARTDSYVAIVTFAHNMNSNGEGVANRNLTGSTDGDTFLKLNFTSHKGDINSSINNINKYSGGSNIEAGLRKALQLLNRENRDHAHKVIVLFSDGLANVSNDVLPGPDWPIHHNAHTAAAVAAGHAAWITARIYTVGLFKEVPAESRDIARETLDWAGNAGLYEAVSEDDMEEILNDIYAQIVPVATDAVVTDKIAEGFELVPGSISGPGVYDEETRTITWDLGEIEGEAALTYMVRAGSSNPGGLQMPISDWAKLDYADVNGSPAQKQFPLPRVDVPPPLAVDAGVDRTLPPGGSIGIGDNLLVSGGTGPYSYLWTCDTDPGWSSNEENPQVSPAGDTIYNVTIKDSKGCTVSDNVAVTILKGSITVSKVMENGAGGARSFPIYVEGNGHTWSMLLSAGESATITGLEPGTYTVREVVPMYYRPAGINPQTVNIGPDNPTGHVTVANRKVNDAWFWDEDEKINTFSVIKVFSSSS